MLILYEYLIAKNYHEIISAMGNDIIHVHFIYNNIMKITSAKFGDFYLDYSPPKNERKGYYKVWIELNKPIRTRLHYPTLW